MQPLVVPLDSSITYKSLQSHYIAGLVYIGYITYYIHIYHAQKVEMGEDNAKQNMVTSDKCREASRPRETISEIPTVSHTQSRFIKFDETDRPKQQASPSTTGPADETITDAPAQQYTYWFRGTIRITSFRQLYRLQLANPSPASATPLTGSTQSGDEVDDELDAPAASSHNQREKCKGPALQCHEQGHEGEASTGPRHRQRDKGKGPARPWLEQGTECKAPARTSHWHGYRRNVPLTLHNESSASAGPFRKPGIRRKGSRKLRRIRFDSDRYKEGRIFAMDDELYSASDEAKSPVDEAESPTDKAESPAGEVVSQPHKAEPPVDEELFHPESAEEVVDREERHSMEQEMITAATRLSLLPDRASGDDDFLLGADELCDEEDFGDDEDDHESNGDEDLLS